MIQIINKTDMKTIILSDDRQFKRTVINMMNSIAYPAEKISTETLSETAAIISSQNSALNVVIDGNFLFDTKLEAQIKEIEAMADVDKLMIVAHVSEDQMENISKIEITKPNIHFVTVFDKVSFNKIFHDGRKNPPLNSANTASQESNEKKPSVMAFEASGHVKDTIDLLNEIIKNPGNFQSLQVIGQKFNGFIGTMAFLGTTPGWKQLRELAEGIDSIAKHYSTKEDAKSIDKGHLDFLIQAAKCSFLILKELRDSKPISENLIKQSDGLKKTYDGMDGIQKYSKESQDSIDAILNDAFNK